MPTNDAQPQTNAKPRLKMIDVITGIIVILILIIINQIFWIGPQKEILAMKRLAQHPAATKIVPPAGLDPISIFMAEDRARQTLATVAGGFLVVLGLFINARNLWVAEQNLEVTRRKLEADQEIAAKNAEIANDKQLTDRFTAAVTNLGSDKIELRLGGIYALERIAAQSSRDHWTVMEVLTATIRDKRKWIPPEHDLEDEDYDNQPTVETDIQAILTVIGRRNADQDQGRVIDLSRTNLAGINLKNANLSRAYLYQAMLSGATMRDIDLSGADMGDAILHKSHLNKCNMSGTVLRGAKITNAFLPGCNMVGAVMPGTDFSGTHLTGSDMSKGVLFEANLSGAKLWNVELTNADLADANLSKADTSRAFLTDADLSGANLEGSIMFRTQGLTQAQIDSTNGKPSSLPPYLHQSTPDIAE